MDFATKHFGLVELQPKLDTAASVKLPVVQDDSAITKTPAPIGPVETSKLRLHWTGDWALPLKENVRAIRARRKRERQNRKRARR